MIEIEELYKEVLEIYDYNIRAIVLHISDISSKSRKNKFNNLKHNKSTLRMETELSVNGDLESYRFFFIKIMDSLLDEINEWKRVSEFDLSGEGNKYYNLEQYSREEGNKIKKSCANLDKELTNIIHYASKVLDNIREDK